MANFIYKKAKQALLNGQINVLNNQLKVLLLNGPEYSPNENSDEFVSNIPANSIVTRSEAVTNVTSANGILDADNVTITGYNGAAFDAVVLYQYSPSDSDARLIFYIDTSDGLPFAGLNTVNSITIFWNDNSEKILSL
jgi:hypothetical protein